MATPITTPSGTTNTIHKTTEGFSKAVIQSIASNQVDYLNILWDNVIENTPKYSGTLKFGWKMQVNSPSVYVPKLAKTKNTYDDPERPDLLKYERVHRFVYLTNNVPYVGSVNDDASGNNLNFIDKAIDKAVDEWLSGQGF